MQIFRLVRLSTVVALLAVAFGAPCAAQGAMPLTYPVTTRAATADTIFGRHITDPYRWLENDLREDPAVQSWVSQERELTERYLAALPERGAVRERIKRIWNFEKLSAPVVRGSRQFFKRNSGLQNQPALYVQDAGKSPKLLLDPNVMSTGGNIVIQDWLPSKDGKTLIYAVQENGSDWRHLHLIDVDSGQDRDLKLEGVRTPQFELTPDGLGLYYTRYIALGSNSLTAVASSPAIYFHRFGTAQDSDIEVVRGPASGRELLLAQVSEDGRWLIISTASTDGTRTEVSVLDRTKIGAVPRPLVTGLNYSWRFVGAVEGKLLFSTTSGAPLGRIVALDPQRGAEQAPVIVVPQAAFTMQRVVMAGDDFVVQYIDGLRSRLHFFGKVGEDLGEIKLPELTIVGDVEGQAGENSLYFTLSSMTMAPTVYRYVLATGQSIVVSKPHTVWNSDDYVIRRIFASSKDGTKIPITLAYRRDLARAAPHPTIVMVYGGWGLSVDVGFYESRFAWMNMGGVFAIAHIRGGGENGDAWHRAALKAGHEKGIDDFLAAAQTLQADGVTTPGQTIAYGSSNGGMMVAATINRRPDLFGVAIPRVPVTDLIRFPNFTAGKTWISEIGDPSKPDEFADLMHWSPLHNIKNGARYPAIMVTTADSDDRVVPMHSFKYIATLQAAKIGERPRLIRIEKNAGHGEGKPTGQLIEEFTDLWSFAAHESGLRLKFTPDH